MQLEPEPPDLMSHFDSVTRKLAAGPGNWISRNDLHNLSTVFGFPFAFRELSSLSKACKLRMSATVATDAMARVWELERIQLQTLHRPLGTWHDKLFFAIPLKNEQQLREHRITVTSVRSQLCDVDSYLSFQKLARQQIEKACLPIYYAESRVRSKLIRWKLLGSSGLLGRRAVRNFELLARWVPPRVRATYFKTVWNGWVTTRRFNSRANQPNVCLLGCKYGEDSVVMFSGCAYVPQGPLAWESGLN